MAQRYMCESAVRALLSSCCTAFRHGRHVGASRHGAREESYRCGPDLRGMGLSAHPDTGYTKKNQAVDIAGMMDALKSTRPLGNARHRQYGGLRAGGAISARITKWVVIERTAARNRKLG